MTEKDVSDILLSLFILSSIGLGSSIAAYILSFLDRIKGLTLAKIFFFFAMIFCLGIFSLSGYNLVTEFWLT